MCSREIFRQADLEETELKICPAADYITHYTPGSAANRATARKEQLYRRYFRLDGIPHRVIYFFAVETSGGLGSTPRISASFSLVCRGMSPHASSYQGSSNRCQSPSNAQEPSPYTRFSLAFLHLLFPSPSSNLLARSSCRCTHITNLPLFSKNKIPQR